MVSSLTQQVKAGYSSETSTSGLIKRYLAYPFFQTTEFLRKSFRITLLLHTHIQLKDPPQVPNFPARKISFDQSQKHFMWYSCCSADARLPDFPMHRWAFPAPDPISGPLLLLPGSPLPGWLTSRRCCPPAVTRLALTEDRCAHGSLACVLEPRLTEGFQLCPDPPFLIFILYKYKWPQRGLITK